MVDGMPSSERRSCSAERPSGSCEANGGVSEGRCALVGSMGGHSGVARTRLGLGDCAIGDCISRDWRSQAESDLAFLPGFSDAKSSRYSSRDAICLASHPARPHKMVPA